jgi:hypothetical protein
MPPSMLAMAPDSVMRVSPGLRANSRYRKALEPLIVLSIRSLEIMKLIA